MERCVARQRGRKYAPKMACRAARLQWESVHFGSSGTVHTTYLILLESNFAGSVPSRKEQRTADLAWIDVDMYVLACCNRAAGAAF